MSDPGTPARVRRDPRDRTSRRAPSEGPVAPAVGGSTAPLRRIAEPACLVFGIMDLEAGRPSRSDLQVMTAVRQLAATGSGAAVMVVLDRPGEALRAEPEALGADRLLRITHPTLDPDDAEARVEAVLAGIAAHGPSHVVFADTPLRGGVVGRRVAARLAERPAVGVVRINRDTVDCRQDAGRIEVSRPLPRILLLAPDSFAEIAETERAEALPLGAAAFTRDGRVEDCGTLLLDPASVPLEEADLILSAGNGVTDWASFHAVAAGLGAAEAGSRVVCDAGLLPRDRQVGASGVLVSPRCYLAFGIAGAPQHLQGIADCKRVIAVNTDLHAAMVGRADLAIVADAQAVLPALARKLATAPR